MKRVFAGLLLVGLLMSGCGEVTDENLSPEQSPSMSEEQGQSMLPEQAESTAEGEGALTSAEGQREAALSVKAVETAYFQEPEEGYTEYGRRYKILGSRIYLLRTEGDGEVDPGRLCVQIYDTEKKQTEQYLLEPRIPEYEDYMISSADLTPNQEISLKMKETWTEDAAILVKMNLEGEILQVTDPFPEVENYPWNTDFLSEIRAFDLADGRTVLSRYDAEEFSSSLTWFTGDTGEEKPLGKLDQVYLLSLMADEEGILYYLGGDRLVRWDTEKDVREELFCLHENGIDLASEGSGIIKDKQGNILLCLIQGEKITIYQLTDKEMTDRAKIQLACVMGEAGIDYAKRCANTFSQNNGKVSIELESVGDQYLEDYRNRILAELAAGKGPELMWVSERDMLMLQEKGLLCDLSELIPEDIRKELIPGVLELGTVDGELVGVVPEASFTTMITGNQTWEKDGWTHEEILKLFEGREDWDWPISFWETRLSSSSLLYMVFANDLAHSPYLDLEQGVSHFDGEEFIHILELCKKYGQKSSETRTTDELLHMLEDGETIAAVHYLYGGLYEFSRMMEIYDKNCHIVGYPSETGSGNYVDSYSFGYLVVNAQAEHKQEIGEYFVWLLDYANQYRTNGCSVRMDVIRDSVVYYEYDNSYVMLRSADPDNRIIMYLPLKDDGSSYLEEFLVFVESCEPSPRNPSQITSIMGGELSPYFEGQKSAQETADLIQKGVQLYLDETR